MTVSALVRVKHLVKVLLCFASVRDKYLVWLCVSLGKLNR